MKAILVALVLISFASLTRATVAPSLPEPDDTAEVISLFAVGAATFINTASLIGHAPNYWLGGAGVAAGVTALALSAQDDVVHQGELLVGGVVTVAISAAAMRHRYVLNQRGREVGIEPTPAAGLALVINF
jgi:hypothetical protein